MDEWKKMHPGEEPEKNWNLSLDGLLETSDTDCSIYARQVAEAVAGDTDRMKDILYKAVEELSPAEKELYKNFGGVKGVFVERRRLWCYMLVDRSTMICYI